MIILTPEQIKMFEETVNKLFKILGDIPEELLKSDINFTVTLPTKNQYDEFIKKLKEKLENNKI
jgi:hypothetical protein